MTVQPEAPPPGAALATEDRRRLLLAMAGKPDELSPGERASAVRTLAGPGGQCREVMGRLEQLLGSGPPPVAVEDMLRRADEVGRLLAALVPYPQPRPDVRVESVQPSHVRVLPAVAP